MAVRFNRSRYTDADARDILIGNGLFLQVLLQFFRHIGKNIFSVFRLPGHDFPLIQKYPVISEDSTLYRCSSYINSHAILIHVRPPLLYSLS